MKHFYWISLYTLFFTFLPFNITVAMMKHGRMMMDEHGMIMNDNHDILPKDCQQLAGDYDLTIRAGHKHAKKFNGKMFAFDQQEWDIPPCSRLNITFINDDDIRHQLMIHGLPGYIYPEGMFHLELYGRGQLTASLIMPGRKTTYLMHCELAQHMEKGMKGQIKVGGGDGDLPGIPGISESDFPDAYQVDWNNSTWMILLFSVIAGMLIPLFILRRWIFY